MPDIIDLGGAPANEDCAQLGHTPDFERLNRLEVATYRAAIIARYGPPPDGCALQTLTNAHDFGTYFTLGLSVDAGIVQRDRNAAFWCSAVQDGLESWLEAGFAPPVVYRDGAPPRIERTSVDEIVAGALLAARPDPDGHFALPSFERTWRHLTAAFPRSAEAAQRTLAAIHA